MNKVILLTGGNAGDRFDFLNQAKNDIRNKIGEIVKESAIYESVPWGFESEQDFLNQVIIITTEYSPTEVLHKCQEIENELGRIRKSKQYSSRTIDIDILFFNNEIVDLPDLTIPHKQLHKRRFTLEPLAEIAPDYIHPVLNKTIVEILKNCRDSSEVKKL